MNLLDIYHLYAKIWCPINEKESKLVYENILYHRLEGLIKGTEEISFSNYDNYIAELQKYHYLNLYLRL